jgi:hypothetical protein
MNVCVFYAFVSCICNCGVERESVHVFSFDSSSLFRRLGTFFGAYNLCRRIPGETRVFQKRVLEHSQIRDTEHAPIMMHVFFFSTDTEEIMACVYRRGNHGNFASHAGCCVWATYFLARFEYVRWGRGTYDLLVLVTTPVKHDAPNSHDNAPPCD